MGGSACSHDLDMPCPEINIQQGKDPGRNKCVRYLFMLLQHHEYLCLGLCILLLVHFCY